MNRQTPGQGRAEDRWVRPLEEMIQNQIIARGVKNKRVLAAMRRVPRHLFVPDVFHDKAYSDRALPIGSAQTISQPYMVAVSLQALGLRGGEKVLEIGAGTGYVTALLADRSRLEKLGCTNFLLRVMDGSFGWADEGPFDAILSAASSPEPPAPWLEQLKPGGCLVMPVGGEKGQTLAQYVKRPDGRFDKPGKIVKCKFVKLIGRHGWSEDG